MPRHSKPATVGSAWILPGHRSAFYEQLGRQLKAGLPLSASLRNVARGPAPRAIMLAVTEARALVEQGESLSVALSRHPQAFPGHDVAFLNAAELAGDLPAACLTLAEDYRTRHQRAVNLAVRLVYPLGLLVAAILLLPIPLGMRMGGLSYVAAIAPGILMLVISAAAFAWLVAMPQAAAARSALSRGAQRMPWIGGKLRQMALARTIRLLAACVGAGLSPSACFRAAESATNDAKISEACAQIARTLDRGNVTIAGALAARSDVFPALLCQIVATGEESGSLDVVLSRAAIEWEEQGQLALTLLFGAARWGVVAIAFTFVGWSIVGEMRVHLQQIDQILE